MNALITSRKSAPLIAATMVLALGYGALCSTARAGNLTRVTIVADVPQVSVSFADVNLSSTEGAATLYQRIAAAASEACDASYQYDESRFARIRTLKCAQHAVRNAMKKIGVPLLVAVYNAHSNKPLPGRTILARNH